MYVIVNITEFNKGNTECFLDKAYSHTSDRLSSRPCIYKNYKRALFILNCYEKWTGGNGTMEVKKLDPDLLVAAVVPV